MIFATTGEVEALLPVIGMLLQFSPEEVKFSVCIRCSSFIGYSGLSHGFYFILYNEISHGKLPLNIVQYVNMNAWLAGKDGSLGP